jgi:hypothetical protein
MAAADLDAPGPDRSGAVELPLGPGCALLQVRSWQSGDGMPCADP